MIFREENPGITWEYYIPYATLEASYRFDGANVDDLPQKITLQSVVDNNEKRTKLTEDEAKRLQRQQNQLSQESDIANDERLPGRSSLQPTSRSQDSSPRQNGPGNSFHQETTKSNGYLASRPLSASGRETTSQRLPSRSIAPARSEQSANSGSSYPRVRFNEQVQQLSRINSRGVSLGQQPLPSRNGQPRVNNFESRQRGGDNPYEEDELEGDIDVGNEDNDAVAADDLREGLRFSDNLQSRQQSTRNTLVGAHGNHDPLQHGSHGGGSTVHHGSRTAGHAGNHAGPHHLPRVTPLHDPDDPESVVPGDFPLGLCISLHVIIYF